MPHTSRFRNRSFFSSSLFKFGGRRLFVCFSRRRERLVLVVSQLLPSPRETISQWSLAGPFSQAFWLLAISQTLGKLRLIGPWRGSGLKASCDNRHAAAVATGVFCSVLLNCQGETGRVFHARPRGSRRGSWRERLHPKNVKINHAYQSHPAP